MASGDLVGPIVGAVLGAGGLAALVKARAENRKTGAEADVTLGSGWQVLWTSAREEMGSLRERIRLAEEAVIAAHRRVDDAEAREQECLQRLAKIENGDRVAIERVVGSLLEAEIAKREAAADAVWETGP